jgi:hypothetical protein
MRHQLPNRRAPHGGVAAIDYVAHRIVQRKLTSIDQAANEHSKQRLDGAIDGELAVTCDG